MDVDSLHGIVLTYSHNWEFTYMYRLVEGVKAEFAYPLFQFTQIQWLI
jgi:hypothetical protein